MRQLPVLGVQLVEALLERVQLHLEGAHLVGELPVVPPQSLVVHLAPVEVVGEADDLVGARLGGNSSLGLSVGLKSHSTYGLRFHTG